MDEPVRRKTQYSARTGRIIPPSAQAYQRRTSTHNQAHHAQPLYDQELLVAASTSPTKPPSPPPPPPSQPNTYLHLTYTTLNPTSPTQQLPPPHLPPPHLPTPTPTSQTQHLPNTYLLSDIVYFSVCNIRHTKYVVERRRFENVNEPVYPHHSWQVLEVLSQILQTDSLSQVQRWLLLAGQRGNTLALFL